MNKKQGQININLIVILLQPQLIKDNTWIIQFFLNFINYPILENKSTSIDIFVIEFPSPDHCKRMS